MIIHTVQLQCHQAGVSCAWNYLEEDPTPAVEGLVSVLLGVLREQSQVGYGRSIQFQLSVH